MGNAAKIDTLTEPRDAPFVDVDSPEDLFFDPLTESDDDEVSIPVPEELLYNCSSFDADEVTSRLKELDLSYKWGDCIQASRDASAYLHPLIKEYNPEYKMVWINSIPANHAYLETTVCGDTYITDFVGGLTMIETTDPAMESWRSTGEAMGFGLHYFSHKTEILIKDPASSYALEPLSAYTSTEPIDATSPDYKEAQAKAVETTIAPYQKIARFFSTLLSRSE